MFVFFALSYIVKQATYPLLFYMPPPHIQLSSAPRAFRKTSSGVRSFGRLFTRFALRWIFPCPRSWKFMPLWRNCRMNPLTCSMRPFFHLWEGAQKNNVSPKASLRSLWQVLLTAILIRNGLCEWGRRRHAVSGASPAWCGLRLVRPDTNMGTAVLALDQHIQPMGAIP